MNQEAATIFVRKNKEKTLEKHPTHKVTIIAKANIPAGTKIYGALWPKTGQDGDAYYAGQAEFPQERERPAARQAPQRQAPSRGVFDDRDDESPF